MRGAIDRARNHWKRLQLQPITLHEARHTYASLMIAAGVNAKAISSFLGHANIAITFDLYGHLMPGLRLRLRAGWNPCSHARPAPIP